MIQPVQASPLIALRERGPKILRCCIALCSAVELMCFKGVYHSSINRWPNFCFSIQRGLENLNPGKETGEKTRAILIVQFQQLYNVFTNS